MSHSSSKKTGEIHVISKFGPIRIELYDHQFVRQALGFGELRKQVPEGLYMLQYSAGATQQEEYVRVGPEQVVSKEVELLLPSVAPIGASSTHHEFHEEPAVRLSRKLSYRSGGGLVIFARTVDGDGKAPVPIERLSLWDAEMQEVGKLGADAERDPHHGWACLAAEVKPGGYVLRWQAAAPESLSGGGGEPQPIDQSLWVAEGWLTLVFIAHNSQYGELERQSASIHMSRIGDGFHPGPRDWQIKQNMVQEWELKEAKVNQALDLALGGLRTGSQVVPDDLLDLLLHAKFQNPMLGIVGAHAMLNRRSHNWELFDHVVNNLQSIVPDHPDVTALRLLGELKRDRTAPIEVKPLSWPPMICLGYRGLIARDWDNDQEIMEEESMAELAASHLLHETPWSCWTALESLVEGFRAASSRVASPILHHLIDPQAVLVSELRSLVSGARIVLASKSSEAVKTLSDPAVQRVSHHIASLKQMGDCVDLETLSLDEFRQTGLPVAVVKRAIRTLINNASPETPLEGTIDKQEGWQ